jgi:hypothetical protein
MLMGFSTSICFLQCFGSGLDPDSIRSLDPDPGPGVQNDPQKLKKIRNIMFLSAECSLLSAEGFSCRDKKIGRSF